MTDTLPCGHPVACVNTDGDTRYCRWCAEVDAARRDKELLASALRDAIELDSFQARLANALDRGEQDRAKAIDRQLCAIWAKGVDALRTTGFFKPKADAVAIRESDDG